MLAKSIKLNNGKIIPTVGLGTWRAEKGVVGSALQTALAVGYKHFDCAYIYENEAEIGAVLKELPDRESIFVTSKLVRMHMFICGNTFSGTINTLL